MALIVSASEAVDPGPDEASVVAIVRRSTISSPASNRHSALLRSSGSIPTVCSGTLHFVFLSGLRRNSFLPERCHPR